MTDSTDQICHPLYPLDPTERLRCTLCDEIMEWNSRGATFKCDCRDLGVAAEAISQGWERPSTFDMTVERDD